ncbi:MAG: aldehyde dehydrogenase family protein [Solirubrobacteraceae bacterium]
MSGRDEVRELPEPLCFIGGEWRPGGGEVMPVLDPATGEVLCDLVTASGATVDAAVAAARAAQPAWAATPATARARVLLEIAAGLTRHADEIAPVITIDNGKSLADARGEIQRAVDHLESAATAPALLHGYGSQGIATGIDASVLREPLGVCAVVAPFNFPIMTGLIYHAWALACGNAVVLKPSEQAPLAATLFARIATEAGLPPGVFNVVHGGRDVVEALTDHPDVASISLVGSSATARAVYTRAANKGKRAHAAGGARNFLVAMPDADMDGTAAGVVASVFGMAGQRCLSSSVLVAVGDVYDRLLGDVIDRTRALTVGSGFDPASDVTPLISQAAVDGLGGTLSAAVDAGARVLLEPGAVPAQGFFSAPAIAEIDGTDSPLIQRETFGPLLAVLRAADLDEALALCNASPFGNAASIFTASGAAARTFALGADVGNIGVNIGVAAPAGQFAFGGRKESFFGTVHSQGQEAVAFYTDPKSVTVRWPS